LRFGISGQLSLKKRKPHIVATVSLRNSGVAQ
jgi:hypothetical protein